MIRLDMGIKQLLSKFNKKRKFSSHYVGIMDVADFVDI